MLAMLPSATMERLVGLSELGDRLAALRLHPASALESMRASMARHGQLTPISGYRADGVVEIIDGFKRLAAARALDLDALRVVTLPLERAEAKAAIMILNASGRLSDLEEGWLVRSLYREDGLSQPTIGQLLGHDKSWVCRRLALAESLEESLQADVHLGVISAR